MSQQKLSYSLFGQSENLKDPFLWSHIALLSAVPLTMVLCMLGLAAGDPILPGWLEMILLGLPLIALPIYLQWRKPLSPYSLWVVAKPVNELSETQRRNLSILKSPITWWIAIAAGTFLYVMFRQAYIAAPLAADITPFPPLLRLFGIGWALVFLAISSFLWQSGISAVRLLLTRNEELNAATPYSVEQIKADFLTLGKSYPHLLQLEFAPQVSSDGIQQVKVELVTPPDLSNSTPTSEPTLQATSPIDQPEPSSELLEEFQDQLDEATLPNTVVNADDEAEFLFEEDIQTSVEEDVWGTESEVATEASASDVISSAASSPSLDTSVSSLETTTAEPAATDVISAELPQEYSIEEAIVDEQVVEPELAEATVDQADLSEDSIADDVADVGSDSDTVVTDTSIALAVDEEDAGETAEDQLTPQPVDDVNAEEVVADPLATTELDNVAQASNDSLSQPIDDVDSEKISEPDIS